jgi:anti-sigma B factor antagonist
MTTNSPASMPAQIEYVQEIPVIAIVGRLDTNSSTVFDEQVAPVLAEGRRRILLDLGGVAYISSAGLRSIIKLIKHTAACGGRTGIFSTPPYIMEVIEISGFPSLLDIYPDRESALAGVSHQ